MTSTIEYGRATPADLPAVVELCMMVEAQHEHYWPLRWKTKPNIRVGYLRWMGNNLESPNLLLAVARDPAAAGEPLVEAVTFHEDRPGDVGPGRLANPTKVVGVIAVRIEDEIPIYIYTQYAYILDLAVAPEYRRRGIAQRLLRLAHDWSAEKGLGQLRLMVADGNSDGRAAFERAGFVKTYQEMVLPVKK